MSVTNITLKNLAAHVLIESNGTMNVLSLVKAGETNVASAILADVEPGILPGGENIRSRRSVHNFGDSIESCAKPGGKMPPSTSARMADATLT